LLETAAQSAKSLTWTELTARKRDGAPCGGSLVVALLTSDNSSVSPPTLRKVGWTTPGSARHLTLRLVSHSIRIRLRPKLAPSRGPMKNSEWPPIAGSRRVRVKL
jgi:hypothetical protein